MTSHSDLPFDRRIPIEVTDAMRRVNTALIDLLAGVSDSEWSLPTVHQDRNVKDLVAHLLHGSLRRVSWLRDRFQRGVGTFSSIKDLTAFIQNDNREFMVGMRGVSPGILCELIARYDPELMQVLAELDPEAPGLGVAWAGEWISPNWFDIAREYTEKWHHQQQLRDALRRPPLYEADLIAPVYQTFARGLPHAYRDFPAPEQTCVSIIVEAPANTAWTLRSEHGAWQLGSGATAAATTTIRMAADLGWRLWTKGVTTDYARTGISVEGERAALEPLLSFVAIMA